MKVSAAILFAGTWTAASLFVDERVHNVGIAFFDGCAIALAAVVVCALIVGKVKVPHA
jgi:hypothetical protein